MKQHKNKTGVVVPEPTLRRLPTYLFLLRDLKNKGNLNISAPVIGRNLKFDSTQVVKDLSYTGISGKPKVGYNVIELIQHIEDFLGFNRPNDAFLIGAGKLGSALISYQGVRDLGIRIIAGFDVDPDIVGTDINGTYILHIDKLENMISRLHISIAILCVPENVAQQVCNNLVNYGVKAIWNFAPINLETPDNIVVQNTSIYSNVTVLLNKLKQIQ